MSKVALIVDDEADIRSLIAMTLDRIGFDTHTAANLEEARNLADSYRFDVCLTDMRLPDGNGIDFVEYIVKTQPDLPVAVITAHGNMDAAVDAMKAGAFDFVSKPVDIEQLRKLVLQAANQRDTDTPDNHTTNQTLASQTTLRAASLTTAATPLDGSLESLSHKYSPRSDEQSLVGGEKLIGNSAPMRELRQLITKVARTNAPVWITGESGTGKELIARLVHQNSARANESFVAVNCGAIPSELMESEMFGHKKGSFTGANNDHEGLFQQANGGTLFLDEVAELPLHMQVKLLRVIQEKSVRHVGGNTEIPTDVRILSASHKNLGEEVTLGKFRHDLYYRLNVISICSPRLADRAGDITDIARFILKKIARTNGLNQPLELSSGAISILESYNFPGNIRELENILERASALVDGGTIEETELAIMPSSSDTPASEDNHVAPTAIRPSEHQDILDALEKTRWNRKAAAEKLGLTYRQLRYRIKQFGIDNSDTGT